MWATMMMGFKMQHCCGSIFTEKGGESERERERQKDKQGGGGGGGWVLCQLLLRSRGGGVRGGGWSD